MTRTNLQSHETYFFLFSFRSGKAKGDFGRGKPIKGGPHRRDERPTEPVETIVNPSLFVVMDGRRLRLQSRRESVLSVDILRYVNEDYGSTPPHSEATDDSMFRCQKILRFLTGICGVRSTRDSWRDARADHRESYPTSFVEQYLLLTRRSFRHSSRSVLSTLEIIRHICQAVIVGLLWFRVDLSEERIGDIQAVVGIAISLCF